MLIINRYLEGLKQWWGRGVADWPPLLGGIVQQYWSLFMGLVALVLLLLYWPALTLFSGLFLLSLLAALTWLARSWPVMRYAIMLTVTLYLFIMLSDSVGTAFRLMIPLSAVLLLFTLAVAVLVDFHKSPLTPVAVSYAGWSAMVGFALSLWLLAVARPSTGVFYAGLPLASSEEFLLSATLVMLFLYLRFQRSHARVQGEFIALLPAVLGGLYAMYLLDGIVLDRLALPDGVLEQGLLLVHVPVMIIAIALLFNVSGFALLRLLSDTPWFKARQNIDIIETIQTALEDYLYRQVRLAVLLLGVGIFTGMLWADLAWGHYWQAEAKVFMSMSLLFYYLAALHFRLQRGMRVRPFAWWCLAGLPWLFLTVFGSNSWSQGLHRFTGL